MTEKVKLTFEEYKKALDAGMSSGSGACCCIGPQDGNEYCFCFMREFDMIVEEDHQKIRDFYRSMGVRPYSEVQAEHEKEMAELHARIAKQEEEKISIYRRKRLELIAAKEAAKKEANG
jgi:hypothetical protein